MKSSITPKIVFFFVILLILGSVHAIIITIDSPTNTTHNTDYINLNWIANETTNWSAYSLDGGTNTSFATEGQYVNNDFSTASVGTGFSSGITQNGTYFWIVNTVDREVYKYYMNGTYTNDHFDIAVSGGSFFGITQNGTYFWIIDWGNDKVYKYYMNGTDTNDYFNISASGNGDSQGITQNGTYFWITDYNAQKIYKYYMNGTYANDYFSTSGSENIYPMGIIQDGTYFWITHYYGGVYKYYMNGTYTNTYFSTTTQGASRTDGITQNETYFWIADYDDKKIYKYYFGNFNNPINTTLTGLSESSHNVIVWANDTSGNMNSTTVYFTVNACTFPSSGNKTLDLNLNCSYSSETINIDYITFENSGDIVFTDSTLTIKGITGGFPSDSRIILFNSSYKTLT